MNPVWERYFPVDAIYEIRPPLSEGRLQIFNDGEITEKITLLDVSPGPHSFDFGLGNYWSSNHEAFRMTQFPATWEPTPPDRGQGALEHGFPAVCPRLQAWTSGQRT
jgi:hypothetical protein